MFDNRSGDPFTGVHWQVWVQDRFDPETPRRVEKEGRGLMSGLKALWTSHVKEGVTCDGRATFSAFNLWSADLERSFSISGSRTGMKKILGWLFMFQGQGSIKGWFINQRLLKKIVTAHYELIVQGEDSREILKRAESANNSQEFINILNKIIQKPPSQAH